MSKLRKEIAKLAKDLCSGTITYEEFMNSLPEMDEDDLIDELVDLIEHEPKVGGLFGVSKKKHSEYLQRIHTTIKKLES